MSYQASGYHTFDGGFLSNHKKITDQIELAPQFIKDKVAELKKYCEERKNDEEAKKELKAIEKRKEELLRQIG